MRVEGVSNRLWLSFINFFFLFTLLTAHNLLLAYGRLCVVIRSVRKRNKDSPRPMTILSNTLLFPLSLPFSHTGKSMRRERNRKSKGKICHWPGLQREIEISNPEIGRSQPIDQTIRPWEIYEKERCSGSYRLAVDFILIKDYVNFSETRLVTVMKSLHRSCWTELTCQGILLPQDQSFDSRREKKRQKIGFPNVSNSLTIFW